MTRPGAGDVNPLTTNAFDLPDALAHKGAPRLVEADAAHFAAIAATLEHSIAELSQRLDVERAREAGGGQRALDRDQEIHRLSARLRLLRRFGLDLCLGRMVLGVGGDLGEPGDVVYVGRLGLTEDTGRRLLVDWRSPAAAPFFGATHADPMGLASRRRYRWTHGRVTDYWDEVFGVAEAVESFTDGLALDDDSAFLASLEVNRSSRMRDVLATIAADQDAIIRAGARGALVVDGGPGTGKTVVALHRSAYLLYSDPRLGQHGGGILFVGPHQPYLAYVADVLPSLGEEGVQTCTLRDLVPEGATAVVEPDPKVARLKSSVDLVGAIEEAVRFYEEVPATDTTVDVDWAEVRVTVDDWAAAFDAPAPGTPHNEARDDIWAELVDILEDKVSDEDFAPADLRKALAHNEELHALLNRAWPLIEPTDLVGDLWTVPAYLRLCAPSLSRAEIRLLQRPDAAAWTVSDLPLLDAARQRLGDPQAPRRRRQRAAAVAAEQAERDKVVEHLIASDDSEMRLMSMLKEHDLQGALIDESALPSTDHDRLAGPFAHVVVDEAQELTDAEWQMLLLRCPSRSFTVVGDRAQARHGFAESWQQRLGRVGLDRATVAPLRVNYRTPQEVMTEAEPVIRAAIPDANVPTSIRSNGIPVGRARVADLAGVVERWLAAHEEGVVCVIGTAGAGDLVGTAGAGDLADTVRVRTLTPELAKGLEFDLVVLVDPAAWGDGIEGAVDRYVAMTRATQQLVILEP